jgi:hypothetical protein
MRDGRSKAPSPPLWIQDELATRNINHYLGTSYTVEEIRNKPYAWIVKMHLLIENSNG